MNWKQFYAMGQELGKDELKVKKFAGCKDWVVPRKGIFEMLRKCRTMKDLCAFAMIENKGEEETGKAGSRLKIFSSYKKPV